MAPWNPISSMYYPCLLEQACQAFGIDMDTPFEKLAKKDQQLVLYGDDSRVFHFTFESDFGGLRDLDTKFEGVIPNVERRYRETNSDFTRDVMRQYMTSLTCQTCHGYRLNKQALAVKIAGQHIGQVSDYAIGDSLKFFSKLQFSAQDEQIAKPILKEICDRLTFLENVGLDPFDKRKVRSYSLGMRQRLGIAAAVMERPKLLLIDEPTNALDVQGVEMVKDVFTEARRSGSTVIFASHDREIVSQLADVVFELYDGALVKEGSA